MADNHKADICQNSERYYVCNAFYFGFQLRQNKERIEQCLHCFCFCLLTPTQKKRCIGKKMSVCFCACGREVVCFVSFNSISNFPLLVKSDDITLTEFIIPSLQTLNQFV